MGSVLFVQPQPGPPGPPRRQQDMARHQAHRKGRVQGRFVPTDFGREDIQVNPPVCFVAFGARQLLTLCYLALQLPLAFLWNGAWLYSVVACNHIKVGHGVFNILWECVAGTSTAPM